MTNGIENIENLKEWRYDLVDGRDAYKYEETTKEIGEYIGRVYGREMKILVLAMKESTPKKPVYPKDGNDENKAIWSKEYDAYMKKLEKYNDNKARVFGLLYKQCTKAMKDRIEKITEYEDLEEKSDVIELLKLIKNIIFDSNERKHPSLRAVLAWRKLAGCRQHDNEDLVNYYRRFSGLVEAVEIAYGNLQPQISSDTDKERSKMIAMMFIQGVDMKLYGYLLKDLETDYSLGRDVYPASIEDALQVLVLYGEKKLKKKSKAEGKQFAQNGKRKCHCCGKDDHILKDCALKNIVPKDRWYQKTGEVVENKAGDTEKKQNVSFVQAQRVERARRLNLGTMM